MTPYQALDSILCSDGATANARLMMQECARLLNNYSGVLICVSHATPENRLMYFENDTDPWWKGGVCVHSIPKPKLGSNFDDQMERSRYDCFVLNFFGERYDMSYSRFELNRVTYVL